MNIKVHPDYQLGDTAQQQLEDLTTQLIKWNKAYNLTAIKRKKEIIAYHLLDSLALSPHIKGNRVADIGTGAGFPGLPLAIAHPDKTFFLIESNRKKTQFLLHMRHRLQLSNVTVLEQRAEAVTLDLPADCILSRAVADIPVLIDFSAGFSGPKTQWLLQKGPDFDVASLSGMPHMMQQNVIHYRIPGIPAERLIIDLKKQE